MIDISGRKFGGLTVVSASTERRNGQVVWNCLCNCGTRIQTVGYSLRNGLSKSCGCLISKVLLARNHTHGWSGTSEYRSWQSMYRRCYATSNNRFNRYGERGIKVCERWSDFSNFIADLGPKPTPKHTLDRINNDGDYEPVNCRWATYSEQACNRSTNRLVNLNGSRMILKHAAEMYGINQTTLQQRLARGWSEERAVSVPVKKWRAN